MNRKTRPCKETCVFFKLLFIRITHHHRESSYAPSKPVELYVRREYLQPFYKRRGAIRLAEFDQR